MKFVGLYIINTELQILSLPPKKKNFFIIIFIWKNKMQQEFY